MYYTYNNDKKRRSIKTKTILLNSLTTPLHYPSLAYQHSLITRNQSPAYIYISIQPTPTTTTCTSPQPSLFPTHFTHSCPHSPYTLGFSPYTLSSPCIPHNSPTHLTFFSFPLAAIKLLAPQSARSPQVPQVNDDGDDARGDNLFPRACGTFLLQCERSSAGNQGRRDAYLLCAFDESSREICFARKRD